MSGKLRDAFGARVRAMRLSRKLTQEVLAERADLSVDAVRRIERGGFSPSLDTLSKLATGLDTSLQTLFRSVEEEHTEPVALISDFLGKRTAREIQLAWRVLRAIFDEPRGR